MNILQRINNSEPRVGSVRFLAIEGHGGSGKSTLAVLLAEQLNAEIIHTDDFAGWDNPEDWWPLLIERVFAPVQKGVARLSYPRSKWWESHNPEPATNQPVANIMILEGVSSVRKEFRPYISFGIFVDTPEEICINRGIERDKGQDGKTTREIRQMWQDWREKEEAYMMRDKPQSYADVVLDGTIPFESQFGEKRH